MLPSHKQTIAQLLSDAVGSLLPEGQARPEIVLERPKQATHGDIACNVALQLAKPLGTNPRELASKIADAIRADARGQRLVAAVEIAGPGFINLRLSAAARADVIAAVFAEGDRYGAANTHDGAPVPVEFVSANPTGPLHVGHGRQAALGDALASLLDWQGHKVHREFYYNDAGVQIHNLAVSVQARARGYKPGDANWPEAAYNGDYIADIAADYLAGKTVRASDGEPVTGERDVENIEAIRRFAVTYLRNEQDIDLQAFGVKFDRYYLESSLYTEGKVQQTVDALVAAGKTYEQEGALWLRTTDDGDDKDRVMRKSDGAYTYFVPDVAYHTTKWGRGFTQVINVQGSDHHGTIARVRAGLQAVNLGIPQGFPDYVLHKMVTVMKGGEEVKISKRAGSYVTLRDLVDWTSRDAVRFFLISRKADTEFVFDVDLALKQNDENPVFYVQYAHARICSVIRKWAADMGGDIAAIAAADLGLLTAPTEEALMLKLAAYPDMLSGAAAGLAPHDVAFYARDLAGAYHSYYAAERVLGQAPELSRARVALLAATRQVLANALALLGVSAPEQMSREAQDQPETE